MKETSDIDWARELATAVFKGKFRNDGVTPEISHASDVAELTVAEDMPRLHTVLAWLHDLIEPKKGEPLKLDFTHVEEILQRMGREFVTDLLHLTRLPGENYFMYITRLCDYGTDRVLQVKFCDLECNMENIGREGSMKDKYRFAQAMIQLELNKS